MRVGYVCADPGVPVFGLKGASVHAQAVMLELVRGGAEVELFAARLGAPAPTGLSGIRVNVLGRPASRDLARRERELQQADEQLPARLAGGRPFDLVYERFSLWSTAGMRHAAAAGLPSILEVNAPLVEEQAEHRGLVDRPEAQRRAATALRLAGAAICVSEPVAAWVRAVAPTTPVHVVPNGVDAARFDVPRGARSSARAPAFTVAFVGTLKPWHGVEVLVQAIAALADVHLLVVGDGPERESLERLAIALRVAHRVHFRGSVAPEAMPAELARADAAAAPYPVAECYFSPLKVFEYLAAGLPVVASRSGQLPQLLTDGADALLVPPGDPVVLAHALSRLRDDVQLRERLGATARVTAQRHTWARVVATSLAAVGLRLPAGSVAV
ncbi:glycosyltransferase family 4 protein [Terrabacter sp. MAHUQ-38]|uniref:glycosyltransferase family 4 protein n=1 Tax=unclassified Terrabacter TaxID=2630222 RepID=UPI00165DC824|nr:glycosyltransferase family 4 protein [Terrabacter sp. MAHUQ-38]MBC9824107.1 glycosyltransferase family 4 protein [Terrabacter sp. MAHUQ-38]